MRSTLVLENVYFEICSRKVENRLVSELESNLENCEWLLKTVGQDAVDILGSVFSCGTENARRCVMNMLKVAMKKIQLEGKKSTYVEVDSDKDKNNNDERKIPPAKRRKISEENTYHFNRIDTCVIHNTSKVFDQIIPIE